MRGPLVATLSFCAVLGSVGSAAAQSESDPAPKTLVPAVDQPLYPPPSASWKVVAAGLGTSAVAYGAATGVSFLYPDAPGAHDLRVPVIGPWLAIANNGCSADEPDCSKALIVLRTVITAIDGLAQAGGIAVAIEGLFMRTQLPRASGDSIAPPRPSAPAPGRDGAPPTEDKGKNLFFLPMPITVGARGVGLGVVGRF